MKNISDTIKNLSSRHIEEIKKILNIKGSSRNIAGIISANLLSYSGMALIISRLSRDERNILDAAYSEKNGITFAELEKRLKLDTEKIEKYTNNLSNKLLVYVLKNRQKLSNKLDRIYLITEIRNFLNPIDNNLIYNYFMEINRVLEIKDISKYKNIIPSIKNSSIIEIIEFIFNSGGIITLEEFTGYATQKSSTKILSDMLQKKYIQLFHDLHQSGKTLIILDKKLFIALAADTLNESKKIISVHNRYYMLLNLLKCYDTVSTYGLFLTKQKEFRKIDKKHLDDSMIKLADISGTEFDLSKVSQLALYLLYIQNCVTIKDDSIIISLKNAEDFLDDPLAWLLKIIKQLYDLSRDEILILPPFDIPAYKDMILMIDLVHKNSNNTYKYIESAFFVKSISELSGDQFIDIKHIRQGTKKKFQTCMRFLCISGIIELENSLIRLSDIGLRIADALQIIKIKDIAEAPGKTQKDTKKIYLNSDFTLITPKKEIPSDALYHILTHTEIIIDDVILHTKISRESILNSLKRGMTNDRFYSTLKKYLKTEIPDNLNFVISAWLTQTIRLNIINAAVLNTNQPSFIDKISHSKIKNSIIKRISPNYAIIDRKYLDKVIKMAKENDAVINLFDESAGFD